LAGLGRHDDAIELFTQVLYERSQILGPDHPDTLLSQNGLIDTTNRLNRKVWWQRLVDRKTRSAQKDDA
jgi:hypothetical protein